MKKTMFFVQSTLAFFLVALLPWYARPLTELLANVLSGNQDHVTSLEVASLCVLIVGVSIFLVLQPIFSYRGRNKAAGMNPRGYALKDYVYSHLIKFFGDFEFAPQGGMLAHDIQHATILPPHYVHTAEDYITGVLHGCTVKIAETELAHVEQKEHVALFKGLLILIDICDSRVQLRGTFSGRTVLIADAQKNVQEITSKYAGYEPFPLADAPLEERFEAYTTHPEEAQKVLSASFMATLLKLQDHLSHLRVQRQHLDDKLAHAVDAVLDSIKIPFTGKLPAEQEHDTLHDITLNVTKANAISTDSRYINQHVQAEFYDDKVLITIPFKQDLFETNSLFEPALCDEDRVLLYSIF